MFGSRAWELWRRISSDAQSAITFRRVAERIDLIDISVHLHGILFWKLGFGFCWGVINQSRHQLAFDLIINNYKGWNIWSIITASLQFWNYFHMIGPLKWAKRHRGCLGKSQAILNWAYNRGYSPWPFQKNEDNLQLCYMTELDVGWEFSSSPCQRKQTKKYMHNVSSPNRLKENGK